MSRSDTPQEINQSGTGRVWPPFRYTGPPHLESSHDKRESFYCHGYREPGEHYHKTYRELEDCPLLRPEGWTPPERNGHRGRPKGKRS